MGWSWGWGCGLGWGLGWAWAWAWGLYWLYLTDLVLCIAAEVTRHGLSSGCGRIDYQPGHARVSRGHDGGSFSDPNGLLEEYWAASRFWEYTEMEWDNGPFGKDIPETAVYIKGGEMERSAIPSLLSISSEGRWSGTSRSPRSGVRAPRAQKEDLSKG